MKTILVLGSVVLAFHPIKAAAKTVGLPDELKSGLVLYFDFDQPPQGGKVVDQSNSKNDGQAVGVKWTSQGHRGGAMNFAKTNNFISVANNPSLNPARFTLSAWIKTSYTDWIWRRIFDKGWNKAYSLSMCGDFPKGNSTRHGQFSLEVGAGGDATSGVRIADGRWHHVAGTFDGTELRLFADGRAVGRIGRSQGKPGDASFDLTIGANRSTPSAEWGEVDASFYGMMDDVMIYSRALTGDEVQRLFLATGGVILSNSPATLVGSPAKPTQELLAGKRFRFSSRSGSESYTIGTALLNRDGTISGIRSPNEFSWALNEQGRLLFKHRDGRVSTVFTQAVQKDGNWSFSGPFQFRDGVEHVLVEVASEANSTALTKSDPGTTPPDASSRLKTLKQMFDQGLITKEDYDKKVKEILESL